MSGSSRYTTCGAFLRTVIEFEHASAAFYRSMQSCCEPGPAQRLLALLERQELEHAETLAGFMPAEPDAMIRLPPDLAAAMPPAPDTAPDLPALFTHAILRERRAQETYEAAARSLGGAFRELMEGLAGFEQEHVTALTELQKDLAGPGRSWRRT